jgi:hypothetical protein
VPCPEPQATRAKQVAARVAPRAERAVVVLVVIIGTPWVVWSSIENRVDGHHDGRSGQTPVDEV